MTAAGREVVEQVPLTAEDLLYPQEGDVVADGFPHNELLQPEADSLRRHLKRRPHTLVTSDAVLVLKSDGRNCSPDLAVIEGEIDRSKIERAVNLRAVGGRLVFALEVVSTSEKEIEEKDTAVRPPGNRVDRRTHRRRRHGGGRARGALGRASEPQALAMTPAGVSVGRGSYCLKRTRRSSSR